MSRVENRQFRPRGILTGAVQGEAKRMRQRPQSEFLHVLSDILERGIHDGGTVLQGGAEDALDGALFRAARGAPALYPVGVLFGDPLVTGSEAVGGVEHVLSRRALLRAVRARLEPAVVASLAPPQWLSTMRTTHWTPRAKDRRYVQDKAALTSVKLYV